MQETDAERPDEVDPLAQIVRAAGRRQVPPTEYYEQVFAATHAVWRRRTRQRRQRRWIAMAAAVALFAAGTVFVQTWFTQSAQPIAELAALHGTVERLEEQANQWIAVSEAGEPGIDARSTAAELSPGTRLRTSNESGVALTMAAGGSLRIHADTEVIVNTTAIDLLAGTLYFDSAGRPEDLPIEILTPLGRVRDIGTQFEVHSNTGRLRVRVRSGEIAVLGSPAPQAVAGQTGDELELSNTGNVVRRNITPDDARWAWAEALAVAPELASPTVHAYLTWIAAETGRQLQFSTQTVRLQAELARFIGDPAGLTPTQLLMTIAATSNFSYELTNDGTILIGRDE